MREELDKHIYTRLLLFNANATAAHFRSTLMRLFLGANIKSEFKKGTSRKAPPHNPDALTISLAPVKGLERTLVKFHEYATENDAAQWPITPFIRDSLRAKIEAPDGDSFVNATTAIISTFDVRSGNGRFKNNLRANKHTPPNLLINVVVNRCADLSYWFVWCTIIKHVDELLKGLACRRSQQKYRSISVLLRRSTNTATMRYEQLLRSSSVTRR